MEKVSVIIPSLLCKYASKTVEDLFVKAKGDIEVIIMLDNYWPDPQLKDHPNLVVVHRGTQVGMRRAVNDAVSIAKGKYIMKCDDHCMFAEGFDEALKADCEEDWLSIPSRWALEPEEWKIGRIGPSEYLYLTYPYKPDDLYKTAMGLHGKKWMREENNNGKDSFYWKENLYKDKKIDDILTTQGSCWFCHRETFLKFGGLDEKRSYLIHQEPQEMCFKFWLSGGRVVINKNTWYAHWHKPQDARIWRKYVRENEVETKRFFTWYWMNDQWPMATKKMKWLIDMFMPMPGWPENWEEEKLKFEAEHPEACRNFKVFDVDGVDALPYKEAV